MPTKVPAGAAADVVAAGAPVVAAAVVPLAAEAVAEDDWVPAAGAGAAWRLCACACALGPWALTSSTERVATKRADSAFIGNMIADGRGQAAEGATRNADVVVWDKEVGRREMQFRRKERTRYWVNGLATRLLVYALPRSGDSPIHHSPQILPVLLS